MNNDILQKVLQIKRVGERQLEAMDKNTRRELEQLWDTEHAYYSSALEGSNIDRNEFDRLAGRL